MVVGTRGNRFSDGILAINRRSAEAVVRTAVNHVSNAAREAFWQENEEVIQAVRWTSTLDGRTSAICRGRDGRFAPVGDDELPSSLPRLKPENARPPAHPNCRSVMVAVVDALAIAEQVPDRPFVRDPRTRRQREIDFRADARSNIGRSAWSRLSEAQRRAEIAKIKRAWARKNIGRVPGTLSYNDWLKRQPVSFQNEVLGITKAKLFRNGDITLDQFLDRRGNELTLEQLALTKPELFTAADLDADDFI